MYKFSELPSNNLGVYVLDFGITEPNLKNFLQNVQKWLLINLL